MNWVRIQNISFVSALAITDSHLLRERLTLAKHGLCFGGEEMKKLAFLVAMLLCLGVALAGCAGVQVKGYSSDPPVQRFSSDAYEVELEPQLKEGQNFFATFRFSFTNKTSKQLNIDWKNTSYTLNGRKSGRFLWEGITWDGLKEVQAQPLIPVSAGDTLKTVIFPANLLGRASAGGGSIGGVKYTLGPLPEGANGIYLIVRQNGKILRQEIVVNIEAR